MLAQGSHRSRRAQLRHLARRVAVPALSRVRRPYVDIRMRFEALSPCPNGGPTTQRPLFSTGSRRACSSASAILWDAPTPVRPSRRTSSPSLGDTIGSSSIRPHRLGTGAVDQPGVGKPELQPAVTMEMARSPKFPGNPCDHSPCSSDPGVTRHADGSKCR